MVSTFRSSSVYQDSVRILFILYFCSDQPSEPLGLIFPENQNFVAYIDSETKLQKIDFWIRYPDYLCAALLYACEFPGRELFDQRDKIKEIVRMIFADNEPELRFIPMSKYLRGAYEPLDHVMAFLSSRDLAFPRPTFLKRKTRYNLTEKGKKAVEEILTDCPSSLWYRDRCRLINIFFGHWNGFEMRETQYRETNYQRAPNLVIIKRIDDEVRTRFHNQFGEPL